MKKCVQSSRNRLGARRVHLYPLFYWNWPYSPDLTDTPLKQYERDWIWFEAWALYAWNPDIPEVEDHNYWIARLADIYGDEKAAEHILDAYNDSGECAPRILRRFGITEGNRQTISLGMTLDELVNHRKYGITIEFWESLSPPGERLQVYVEKEWKKEQHKGGTPPQIIREILDYSQKAVEAVNLAQPHVKHNQDELARLRNDMFCIRATSECYAAKANAAMHVLRYDYSKDIKDMEKASEYLKESFEHFKRLAALTEKTYRFANNL